MQEKKATGLRRQHQLAKISIQTVFTISVLLRYLAALSLSHTLAPPPPSLLIRWILISSVSLTHFTSFVLHSSSFYSHFVSFFPSFGRLTRSPRSLPNPFIPLIRLAVHSLLVSATHRHTRTQFTCTAPAHTQTTCL